MPRRYPRGRRGASSSTGTGNSSSATPQDPTPAPQTSDADVSPIAQFFLGYAQFDYNPENDITDELNRMFTELGWTGDNSTRAQNRDRQRAYTKFKEALVLEFNMIYGTDARDIESWKALCRVLGISPIPETLSACRKAVKACNVNLVDLVDRKGVDVHIFPNLRALRQYTIQTEKFFPRQDAKAGGLLKFLLRNITGRRRGGPRRIDAQ